MKSSKNSGFAALTTTNPDRIYQIPGAGFLFDPANQDAQFRREREKRQQRDDLYGARGALVARADVQRHVRQEPAGRRARKKN